jgi:hypothetical protein
MSKPTYINKATLEELTSIAGIGEIRAQKMLKKKQENGSYLTLQDLKLMTDIPVICCFDLVSDYPAQFLIYLWCSPFSDSNSGL